MTDRQPPHGDRESNTRAAETILLGSDSFEEGMDQIRHQLLTLTVQEYFADLLQTHGLTQPQAVRNASLDKDFGRQILVGERGAHRDTYLMLAFAMGLTFPETQSMLNFLGKGPIYVIRERDAAILYALNRGYSLINAQLLLEDHELPLLGEEEDAGEDAPPAPPPKLSTQDIEQYVRRAESFEQMDEEIKESYVQLSISSYFHRLLRARGLTRKEALKLAGLKESRVQLLNGTRTARNPDEYVCLALAMRLTLSQTQQMLKYVKKGELYPLKERDAALVFAIGHGFSLAETRQLLLDHGLPPL